MKKMTSLFLCCSVAVLALLLAGCSGKNAQDAAQDAVQSQTQQAASAGTEDIGQGISQVQQEQQDLNTDQMNDIDAALGDIEKS